MRVKRGVLVFFFFHLIFSHSYMGTQTHTHTHVSKGNMSEDGTIGVTAVWWKRSSVWPVCFLPDVCNAEYKVCVHVFTFKVLVIGTEVPLVTVLSPFCENIRIMTSGQTVSWRGQGTAKLACTCTQILVYKQSSRAKTPEVFARRCLT